MPRRRPLKSSTLPDTDALELPTVSFVTKSYVVSSRTRPVDRLYPADAERLGANAHRLSERDMSRSSTDRRSDLSSMLCSRARSKHSSRVHRLRLSASCAIRIYGSRANAQIVIPGIFLMVRLRS